MNERIRELAEHAEGTKKHVPAVWQFYDHELEKFTELIVRECALAVQDFVDHRFPASEYPNRLKEYFEVE